MVDRRIADSIARAVRRVSEPIDISSPQSLEQTVASSFSEGLDADVVQVGLEEDTLLVINPNTSEVLRKSSKAETYNQLINSVQTNHQHKSEIYATTLSYAQQRMRLSMYAAVLGFLVILGGVAAMFAGYVAAGLVTSAAGIISEAVAAIFYREGSQANQQLSSNLEQLLEVEGYFTAFAIADQVTDEQSRNQLLDKIVEQLLGLRATSDK